MIEETAGQEESRFLDSWVRGSRQRWLSIDELTRQRLSIVLIMGLLLTAIEMIDHFDPGNPTLFNPEFWHRLPIYSITLPLITWVLLGLLGRSERARSEAEHTMDRLTTLNQTLLGSTQWDDLVETIIRFPTIVAPVSGAALFLYHEDEAVFEPAGAWHADGGFTTDVSTLACPDACAACPSPPASRQNGIGVCLLPEGCKPSGSVARYCASLRFGDRLLGVLHINLPAGVVLSEQQRNILNRALPEMTLALANARLWRSASGPAPPTLAERRQIAQDLHDTLAQNIGYLRLKLDQFAIINTSDTVMVSADVRQDLECMREVAHEAYEQVRGTLASLYVGEQGNLVSLLRERARVVGDRAGIDIRVASLGEPIPLAQGTRHQVLNIVREALNNVEKHAKAQSALVQLVWEKSGLLVEIEDDGVGFDPVGVQTVDHLGLSIMVQRAQAVAAKLTITSAPGSGTRVTLWVPVP